MRQLPAGRRKRHQLHRSCHVKLRQQLHWPSNPDFLGLGHFHLRLHIYCCAAYGVSDYCLRGLPAPSRRRCHCSARVRGGDHVGALKPLTEDPDITRRRVQLGMDDKVCRRTNTVTFSSLWMILARLGHGSLFFLGVRHESVRGFQPRLPIPCLRGPPGLMQVSLAGPPKKAWP